MSKKIETIIQNYQNHKIIITADANAKSPLWHSNVATGRDRRGELLEGGS